MARPSTAGTRPPTTAMLALGTILLLAVPAVPAELPADGSVRFIEDRDEQVFLVVGNDAKGGMFLVAEDLSLSKAPGTPSSPAAPAATDPFGNSWTLRPNAAGDNTEVFVLPAQAPDSWRRATEDGTSAGPWQSLVADELGGIWVAGGKRLRRLDPRAPTNGWVEFTPADGLPDSAITALALAASGRALVGLASGQLFECDLWESKRKVVTNMQFSAAAGPIRAAHADGKGNTWIVSGTALARIEPASGAWQRRWKLVCRLPFGNHDFDPAVIGNRLYLAGGYSHGFGFPAVHRHCDEIWALDWTRKTWQVEGRLPAPRWYAGLAAMDGKIWIVNGQIRDGDRGKPTNTVLVYDPQGRRAEDGPATSVARFGPVAVTLGERVYVCGGERESDNAPAPMESIGAGEKEWRKEPPTPVATGPVAGCEYGGKLYLLVPRHGVVVFDPATGRWDASVPAPPQKPRSSQVAGHAGMLWLLGGRDTRTQTGVFRYNFEAKAWDKGPDIPRPMAWGAAAELGGNLTITAGAVGRCFANQTYVLRPD